MGHVHRVIKFCEVSVSLGKLDGEVVEGRGSVTLLSAHLWEGAHSMIHQHGPEIQITLCMTNRKKN